MQMATCIGCGCDDLHGCWDEEANAPCHWLRVDRDLRLGVCSACPGYAQRWEFDALTRFHSCSVRPSGVH